MSAINESYTTKGPVFQLKLKLTAVNEVKCFIVKVQDYVWREVVGFQIGIMAKAHDNF